MTKDVAEDVLGAAEDGSVKVFTHPPILISSEAAFPSYNQLACFQGRPRRWERQSSFVKKAARAGPCVVGLGRSKGGADLAL